MSSQPPTPSGSARLPRGSSVEDMRDTRRMMPRAILGLVLALTPAVAAVNQAPAPAVVNEIEQFRAKHEEDYRRQFVPLAGLFDLKPGVNTVGSAPASDVKLPKSAPASVGRFIVSDAAVRFEPAAGAPAAVVRLKDQPV